MKFVIKYISEGNEHVNSVIEDLAQALGVCRALVELEATYAWVELDGYPQLKSDVFSKPAAKPVEKKKK